MRAGQGKIFAFFSALLFPLSLLIGQEIKVNGGFVEDSLLIGQDINYFVTATYPAEIEVVFPDSGFKFSPFEYSSKRYFPTALIEGMAYDSTVYTIQSYEIDLVQYLQLPTTLLDGLDSTVILAPLDSIYLIELAPMVSDTTRLIANADYQDVDMAFNYPLLYYIMGAFIISSIVLLLIFGKRITRFFRLRKLRKDYERFSSQLTAFIRRLKTEPDYETAENALNTWKKYQERLEKFPFTKSTTKEILMDTENRELETPLKSIDRLIYGKRDTKMVYQDFQQIEDFTQHRYLKKVQEIKHGK